MNCYNSITFSFEMKTVHLFYAIFFITIKIMQTNFTLIIKYNSMQFKCTTFTRVFLFIRSEVLFSTHSRVLHRKYTIWQQICVLKRPYVNIKLLKIKLITEYKNAKIKTKNSSAKNNDNLIYRV